jgi:hypothetical protein
MTVYYVCVSFYFKVEKADSRDYVSRQRGPRYLPLLAFLTKKLL